MMSSEAESDGEVEDQYTGLDRFGRVFDQRWVELTTRNATERFEYARPARQRLYHDNLVNGTFRSTGTTR